MKIHDTQIKLSRVLVLIIIAVVVSIGVTRALTTQPFTINQGIYPGGASYTIFNNDEGYCLAKNVYGVVVYSGTDATTVFQAVFDLDPDSVFILNGEYDVGVIDIDSHCHIKGESWNTILDGSELGNGEYIFNLNGTLGSEKTDVTIENLRFYTGYTDYVGGAIYMNYVYKGINILNNQFECGPDLISEASAVAIRIDNSNTGIVISNNDIQHYTYRGINLQAVNDVTIEEGFIGNGYASSDGIFTYGAETTVQGVNFGGGGIGANGLRVGEGSTQTIIKESYFELNPGSCIVVGTSGSSDPVPETTIIKDNYFDSNDPNFYFISVIRANWTTLENNRFNGQGDRCIYLKDSDTMGVSISGVYMIGTITSAVVNGGATQVYTSGYGFEVSGISNGTGAQQTLSHGLYGIPDYVWFSDINSGTGAYQSAASDDTNIYVTAASGKEYAYKAVYVP